MAKGKKKTKKKESVSISIHGKFVLYALLIGLIQFVLQAGLFFVLKGARDLELRNLLFALINLAALLALIASLGWLYYKSLKKIETSIDALAAGETVQLQEEGIAKNLAASINKTSDILDAQRKWIAKRDNARVAWIRGVSHDIRTPLSMVMGYAEVLEEDETLGKEQRRRAAIIKEQSLHMRALIEDLNLTSKLEYNRQPLRLAVLSPAKLLRETVAVILNAQFSEEETEAAETGEAEQENQSEKHEITLLILPEFEKISLQADQNLLRRVFHNIIGNAVRHNPAGCSILILAHCEGTQAIVEIADDGKGIPENVAQLVNAYGSNLASVNEMPRSEAEKCQGNEVTRESAGEPVREEGQERERTDRLGVPHVMGMRIAKQIMLAHGGNLVILPDRHTVELIFDCSGKENALKK